MDRRVIDYDAKIIDAVDEVAARDDFQPIVDQLTAIVRDSSSYEEASARLDAVNIDLTQFQDALTDAAFAARIYGYVRPPKGNANG
ncbi:MAG: hypothetical protein ORO03_06270 [Alphaproteobacteria bacterium]|nr:hypothetical protein [Alphaproteobacteria bacterium]